jgi:hypothetical protein
MSHTMTVKDEHGREWNIIHNADWSGHARIVRYDGEEIGMPGVILRKAGALATVNGALRILEQWDGTDEEADVAVFAF